MALAAFVIVCGEGGLIVVFKVHLKENFRTVLEGRGLPALVVIKVVMPKVVYTLWPYRDGTGRDERLPLVLTVIGGIIKEGSGLPWSVGQSKGQVVY